MPGRTLTTDALVLDKRLPADAFQTFTVFSISDGILTVLQRIAKKPSGNQTPLDLFDEVGLLLETSNQGRTWFVKESRLLARPTGIGRDYATLQLACALAALVARNPLNDDSLGKVYSLLQTAFAAFATSTRPDLVFFKSLYCFARDEGHPLKQHWFPTLPAADRTLVADLLNKPVSDQTTPPDEVARLRLRLENYLRGHTEIVLP